MGRPRKTDTVSNNTETKTTSTTAKKSTATAKSPREKQLESEVTELKNLVKDLQEIVMKTVKTDSEVANAPVEKREQYFDGGDSPLAETVEIPFRQYVRVMSLTKHKLTVSTEGFGNGTVYNFTNYGQVQSIIYEDLAKIIHNNERFAREGYFLILDPRVVKIHNLEEQYSKIVDKKTIDNILNLDVNSIQNIVSKTSPHIKNTIVATVVEKILNNEQVDLNKVNVISVSSGKDINEIIKHMTGLTRTSEEE